MKNLKNLFILLFTIALFSNCSNDEEQNLEDSIQIELQFQNATTAFIDSQTGEVLIDPNNTSRAKWWEVALSDIIGGAVGTLTGGPVGGVLLGVGCSVAAGLGIAPPPNDGGVSNNGNAYDYAGELHTEILNEALTTERAFVIQNGVLNFDNLQIVANRILQENGINSTVQFSETDFFGIQSYVDQAAVSSGGRMSIIAQNMGQEGKISNIESQILSNYFSAFENSSSFQAFLGYSVQMETMIEQSNLSSNSKELILFTMATARHDLNYWFPN